MAKNTGPSCKQCRREGTKLHLKGDSCNTEKCIFSNHTDFAINPKNSSGKDKSDTDAYKF